MAKRGSNIYLRKDGRYEGRVTIGYTESGRVRHKSVYAKTLAEVKQKMEELYSMRDAMPVASLRVTVQEGCEQWLAAARLRLKASSYANYENIIHKHILPKLGQISFTALTTAKLNEFVYDKLKHGRLNGTGGLSAKSVRDIMTVYRSIEHYVSREYGIRESHFTMPKPEYQSIDALNKAERKRLEQHLLANSSRTNMGILLCLYSGLRIGELCGLKWGDVDFQNGVISVSRTVQRVNHHGSSEIVVGTPKSRTSVREIPIPKFVLEQLEKYKESNASFILSGNAKPVEPRTMQNRFKAILKVCKLRNVNFHLLRHTYATVCIESGFDVKTLSELLGHADAALTLNRYVHSSMDTKKKFVKQLELCN